MTPIGGSRTVDLSGPWRAAALSTALHRSGADPDLDDSDWPEIEVPGHWGTHPEFAPSDGPILYRRSFPKPPRASGNRYWLVFEGVMAQSDVWLDGHYLGATNGYFVPHRFELPDTSEGDAAGTVTAGSTVGEHMLAVEVSCPPPSSQNRKQSLTGTIQSGPLAPPGSPGGIWKPVGIETTGQIAILHSRLSCLSATSEKAELALRLVLDAAGAGDVRVDTNITSPEGVAVAGGTETHALAGGENRIDWTVPIELPSLWWPKALGAQPMYEVSVSVRDENGEVTDRRSWRTGLRDIDMSGLVWTVNGERIYAKGISIGPQDRFLGTADAERLRQDLRSAQDAGLDLIRIHGHITRPEVYDEADRLGLLIWQDLPLVGGYAMSSRRVARTVAREAVDLLGHHPAVAVWCAHDEPNGPPLPEPAPLNDPFRTIGRRLSRHLFPSWNRSILDPIVRRELESNDPSRPVIQRSGSLPLLTEHSASDSHLWLGWHAGQHEDLAEVIRSWPRLGAFLGGFGSQSVQVRDWDENEPTWATAEVGAFERYLHRHAYADGTSWALATQAYQADLIRSQIETMRRLKYRPAGGFCLVSLFDAEEAGGFGILDHDRRPKAAYVALVDACRPVIIVADKPPSVVTPDAPFKLDVHAVSDLRHRLENVRAKARATCGDWTHERRWEGDLPADSCEFVGSLEFNVPAMHGLMVVDLELDTGERVVTNRFQTVVIPSSEARSGR